jgi:L-cysteine/cystine lyase
MRSTWALAALETLAEAGWQWVHGRAAKLAGWLAERLGEEGLEVFPRGDSTLVSWRVPDAQAEVERLSARGFVVRSIPALELVRASVGAWSAEEELDALVGAAVGS